MNHVEELRECIDDEGEKSLIIVDVVLIDQLDESTMDESVQLTDGMFVSCNESSTDQSHVLPVQFWQTVLLQVIKVWCHFYQGDFSVWKSRTPMVVVREVILIGVSVTCVYPDKVLRVERIRECDIVKEVGF